MIVPLAAALALRVLASACPEPAVTGVQPCDDLLKRAMIDAGAGKLGSAGWAIKNMHSGLGSAAKLVPGWVPCVILSSVAATESSWHQFGYVPCGQSAPTLISADCGYGIGQITSGMNGTGGYDPKRVAGDAVYNLSVSVNILISKWQYTASVTPNDPKIAEDWYFALWGYNGLAEKNNPNMHPDTIGTYFDPDHPAYPRSHYPYQEIVYGYALHPRTGSDGKPRWPSTQITHINFSEICGTCANPGGSTVVSRPSPEHSGDCEPITPDWAAQFVSQSFPLASQGALTLGAGESVPVHIEMKNVGAKAWDSSTRLGTTSPRDRESLFADSSWLGPGRPAAVTGSVPPGGSYKFQFTVTAPLQAGEYAEHFGLLQEGVAWFGDPGQGGPPDEQLQARISVLAPDLADAGLPPDASGTPAVSDGGLVTPLEVTSGCGCAASAGAPVALGAALLLGLARRRR